ncbi:hypothetical protein E2F43_04240 [Seongchinamella unica]|uniref:Uncharacterized protein n=1 Tax=Seongchinamella unica TaxID=2547392 RepID=A0A4R5LW17_9GAMM|nr:hypothetical protein [Seongchinamella unica]TDG15448.1 hypothetical protein E2F43_04240 [Seongchinamella unica]
MIRFVTPSLAVRLWLIAGCAFPLAALATSPVTEIATADVPQGTPGPGFGWRWGDSPYKGIGDISTTDTDEASDLLSYYDEGRSLFLPMAAA